MRPLPDTPAPGQESVWRYPRPAIAEPSHRHIRIAHAGIVVADTVAAVRTIETSHPPGWYIPPADITPGLLRASTRRSFCEWKGEARYWHLEVDGRILRDIAWSYPDPTPAFASLRDHVAFYAAPLDLCTVDGEQVRPPATRRLLRGMDHRRPGRAVQGCAGQHGMVTAMLPPGLADWREAPRVRPMNDRPVAAGGRYVLCWLQQALRAGDNPVIDAAVRLGNALGLPVLVYHGLREDYPYASDRLHRFILGASGDLAIGCRERGLACIQHVDREGHREKGLVYRLGTEAAALVLEDQPTFVTRWQAARVAARIAVPVYAVNAACLVPPAVLGDGIAGRSGFLRRHEPERAAWIAATDEVADVAPFDGPLPFVPDRLEDMDLDALIAGLDIDHSLPASRAFPAGRAAADARLRRLSQDVLPGYATVRNDATRREGASGLSPYLHFGVLGPREVMRAVSAADAGARHKTKFADELLGWREWFHYQARGLTAPERYDRVADWARATLADHAGDPRPDIESLAAMLRGETRDESWNACQRQFLRFGWMHNNLRMYWAKRIIAMTPDPETAWATACYLNDRLSLDGRDPSTYGNIAAMFGGAPGDRERPVHGRVTTRGDGSTRARDGGDAWLARAATRPTPAVTVPDDVPRTPYLG